MKKRILLIVSLALAAALLSGCALPTLVMALMGTAYRSDAQGVVEPQVEVMEDGMYA